MAGAATYIENAIDQILANFVTAKSAALCSALLPVALTGTTIYLLVIGYAVMRGEAQDSLHSVLWKWVKISMIAGVALAGGEYQATIVSGINGIPGVIHDVFGGAATMGGLVDSLADPLITLKKALWTKASLGMFPDLALVVAALLVGLCELLIIVVAIGVYMLAKVGLALALATGPIFVMCAMWPVAQRYFQSWLGTALTLTFTQGLLGAAIGMLYTVIEQFANEMSAQADTTDLLTDAGSLLAIVVVIGIIVLRIPGMAAQMAGGSSIDGIGREVARGVSNMIGGRASSSKSPPPPRPTSANEIRPTSADRGGYVPLYQRHAIDFMRRAR